MFSDSFFTWINFSSEIILWNFHNSYKKIFLHAIILTSFMTTRVVEIIEETHLNALIRFISDSGFFLFFSRIINLLSSFFLAVNLKIKKRMNKFFSYYFHYDRNIWLRRTLDDKKLELFINKRHYITEKNRIRKKKEKKYSFFFWKKYLHWIII